MFVVWSEFLIRISMQSMATPHVAGLAAYLIALEGNRTPAALAQRIKDLATKSVLTGVRE
jgi:subtilisin family serine protease